MIRTPNAFPLRFRCGSCADGGFLRGMSADHLRMIRPDGVRIGFPPLKGGINPPILALLPELGKRKRPGPHPARVGRENPALPHPLRPDPLAARPGRFDSFPPPRSPCPAGRAHRAHRGPCCSASAAIAKPWFLPGPVTMRDAEAQDWPSLRAEIAVSRPAGCQPLPVPVDRVASGTGTNGRASHGRASAPWRQGEYLLLPGISAAFSAAPRWRP